MPKYYMLWGLQLYYIIDLVKDSIVPPDKQFIALFQTLIAFVEHMELTDSYSVFNPTARRVTRFDSSKKSGCRLDYMFVSVS